MVPGLIQSRDKTINFRSQRPTGIAKHNLSERKTITEIQQFVSENEISKQLRNFEQIYSIIKIFTRFGLSSNNFFRFFIKILRLFRDFSFEKSAIRYEIFWNSLVGTQPPFTPKRIQFLKSSVFSANEGGQINLNKDFLKTILQRHFKLIYNFNHICKLWA